jgi:anti-anti-sigma factor
MLQVNRRRQEEAVVLDLAGPIDGSDSCRAIHRAIHDELERGTRRFVMNLQGVDWVNSLGVGFLVAAAVAAVKEEALVRVIGMSPRVGTALHACGVVPNVWKEFGDEGEALRSFA